MALVQPTLLAPVSALLSQVAKLLREGVDGWVRPDPFVEPYWSDWNATPEDARGGAPAGHFLFQEGTRLYLDEHYINVKMPCCIVALQGEPRPLDERVPACYWNVPVVVECVWAADQLSDAQLRDRIAMIMGLLCIDYPAVGADPARPVADRLSVADSLLVYGGDSITAVRQEPLRSNEGHPVARLSFTVLCSALPTP